MCFELVVTGEVLGGVFVLDVNMGNFIGCANAGPVRFCLCGSSLISV